MAHCPVCLLSCAVHSVNNNVVVVVGVGGVVATLHPRETLLPKVLCLAPGGERGGKFVGACVGWLGMEIRALRPSVPF